VTKKPYSKRVYEGEYVAEVAVELIVTDEEWSPYLSLEDAYKLDEVREALRRGDLESTARFARVFKLVPMTRELLGNLSHSVLALVSQS
jgi:hypothetical protein